MRIAKRPTTAGATYRVCAGATVDGAYLEHEHQMNIPPHESYQPAVRASGEPPDDDT